MPRNVLNIILSVLAVVLLFIIIKSVKDPIDKQNEIDRVEAAIIFKLEEIKKAQMTYKDMNDTFASNFPDLIAGIKNGKLKLLKKLGGKNADTSDQVQVDTVVVNAFEETFEAGYPIDQLGKVPPSNEETFQMKSAIIDKNGIQIPVFEVIDPNPLNPKRTLKLGSLTDAIYTGSWK